MDESRRRFCQVLAGGTILAISGCIDRLAWWERSEPTSADEDEDGDSSEAPLPDNTGDANASDTEGSNESDGDSDTNETETETETEAAEENPPDESTRPETVDVDSDGIEVRWVETDRDKDRGFLVYGEIENTTAETIDQVSVQVMLYDADGTELLDEWLTDGTIGLAEWARWKFSIAAHGSEFAERVDSYDLRVVAEEHQ